MGGGEGSCSRAVAFRHRRRMGLCFPAWGLTTPSLHTLCVAVGASSQLSIIRIHVYVDSSSVPLEI